MKIAISVKGQNPYILDSRFGRCEGFWIYDTETKEETLLTNEAVNAQGGAGVVCAQCIVDQKVDVLITGHLGPNAFQVLGKTEIQLVKGEEAPVMEVVEAFQAGKLEIIETNGPAHHGA